MMKRTVATLMATAFLLFFPVLNAGATHLVSLDLLADCDGFDVTVTANAGSQAYAEIDLTLVGPAGSLLFENTVVFGGATAIQIKTLSGSWGDIPCGVYTAGGTVSLYKSDGRLMSTMIFSPATFVCECICGDGILDPGEACEAGVACEDPKFTCDESTCSCTPPVGGEGCTPGYWKQKHHFGSWTGYLPGTLFVDAFGVDAFPRKKLVDVLSQGGGGLYALGRHAVAALLNASSPGVAYGMTPAQAIAIFQEAFALGSRDAYEDAKNRFEGLNEQGCPLGRWPDCQAGGPRRLR